MELEETAVDLAPFCTDLDSMFREMMEEKGISFDVEAKVSHSYIFGDATKVREIFMNLLSNAYKYTNPGGHIHLLSEELPSDKEGYIYLRATISDDGIGMSEEFQKRIFEEFSRENSSTDTKVEGTGLGMPIVKRLVELMHGTIEVKSKKNVGTAVVVTLPHRIAQKSDVVSSVKKTDTDFLDGKRILLVEDNDLNAEIAAEILGEQGLLVERAENGNQCIEMLDKADDGYYDLILMDIQMPGMNGYDATTMIRKMENAEKASIPIIAMTANAFEEDRREAFRCGMNGHVAKPINIKSLMVELSKMLG